MWGLAREYRLGRGSKQGWVMGYRQEQGRVYRELDCNWPLGMGCRKMQALKAKIPERNCIRHSFPSFPHPR